MMSKRNKMKEELRLLNISMDCVMDTQLKYRFETTDDAIDNLIYTCNNCIYTILQSMEKYKKVFHLYDRLKLGHSDELKLYNMVGKGELKLINVNHYCKDRIKYICDNLIDMK